MKSQKKKKEELEILHRKYDVVFLTASNLGKFPASLDLSPKSLN